jgi:hypothetical protein
MSYSLSHRAKKKKLARDLLAAKTPERRRKKAENQRKRRRLKKKGINLTGKDIHHCPSGSLKVAKTSDNRGNFGRGTKKEK